MIDYKTIQPGDQVRLLRKVDWNHQPGCILTVVRILDTPGIEVEDANGKFTLVYNSGAMWIEKV
jgi:hypothetical protein